MHGNASKPWLFALAILFAGTASAAALETSGFLQSRVSLTEGSDPSLNTVGINLQHLRVRLAGEAAPGVSVAVMPEMAGGFQLLDAYADWSPRPDGGVSLRVGQFKFPFGLDRMAGPQALWRAQAGF